MTTHDLELILIGHVARDAVIADLHIGIQIGRDVVDLVPARDDVRFTTAIRLVMSDDRDDDFRGPVVQGPRGGRFVYLVWNAGATPGAMIGRTKVPLRMAPTAVLHTAARSGDPLVAHLNLTDERGRPRFASLPADVVTWSLGQM